MTAQAITAANVDLVYRDRAKLVPALRGLTVSVDIGEFIAVIGPSGCGKTSILRLIADLVKPTAGSLVVLGKTPAEARKEGSFSFVFQNPVLLPWRTVLGNVQLPGELRGKLEVDPFEALKLVELEGAAHLYPHELSGGMQQRAALARAISFHPKILLLDEPFSSVDELARERLNLLLGTIHDRLKMACVLVTHSVTEAAFLADRVLVLSNAPGKIRKEIHVPFGRPRHLSMLATKEFTDTVNDLRTALA